MQKITLLGNIGRNPEERTTKTGVKLVSFSLAVSPRKDQTVWYECQIWENKLKTFEKLLPYLKKGSRILVCGDFKTPETYQGKDGSTKIRLQLEPNYINFIGSPKEDKKENTQPSQDNHEPTAQETMNQELPF